MTRFDSGVVEYVHAYATVHVTFPVDMHGVADISCKQCKFFRKTYQTCALNDEPCEYPQKYVGSRCPLIPSLEANDNNEKQEENEQ